MIMRAVFATLAILAGTASAHAQSGQYPANQFLGGPTSGGAAPPRPRALVGADLPSTSVQSVVNDTNIQGTISGQVLTFSWAGTLAAGRLNANVVQGTTNDTNVTGSIAAQNLTLGWAGTLAVGRGGTGGGAASGTLLDNITGFASTGFLTRTGAGAYAFQSATNGITNANLAQMPASTVKCNPTSATANAQDCPGVGTGFAEMKPFPSQGAGAWKVVDPFGNAISTAGTTCQGFDKLVAAASANGWSWRVLGTGAISCTAPIALPTCFAKTEYMDAGITFNFTAQGASNLITVNSHENCYSKLLSQIVQTAGDTGVAFNMAPTTNNGGGNTTFAASYIETPTSITPAVGGIGIQIDLTSGGFNGNTVFINDVNNGATAIKVVNPGTAFIAFEQNRFVLGYIHGQTTRVGQIGTSTTNAGNMRYNSWSFGRIDPGAGATVAWDTWESNSTYVNLAIDNETANATTGLKFETGANNNTLLGGVVQATTPLSDSGTGNVYLNVKNIGNTLPSSPALSGTVTGNGTIPLPVLANMPGSIQVAARGVNFNAGNTDTAVTFTLPAGVTRWRSQAIQIAGASASISTATVGVFTGAGGTGQTIAANQAITVTTASENTNNNMITLALTNQPTESYTVTTLQVRVGTAQGSTATADVILTLFLL